MIGKTPERMTVPAIARTCVVLQALLLSSGHALSADEPSTDRMSIATAPSAVKSRHYQLQDIQPTAIANSSADLAVIDDSGENDRRAEAHSTACRKRAVC
jgi:hypothetical protein